MFPCALLFGMYNGKTTWEYGVLVIFLFSTLCVIDKFVIMKCTMRRFMQKGTFHKSAVQQHFYS